MRIAIVAADWPATTGGGVAAITATLADALHAAGQEVQVWTRGGGGRDGALRAERRGYPVVGLPGRSWRRRGAKHWRRGLPGLVADFEPETVLASTWDPLPAAADLLTISGRSLRVFAHGRDITGDPGAHRRSSREAVWAAPHRWFCLTRWMEGQLRARGVSAERVVRVPAAVPAPLAAVALETSPEAQPRRVLAVGRLVPRKGQDVLIEAMARLPEDTRLDVVGEGPDLDRLWGRVAALGLADRVTLHGGLPAPALEALWRRATCFALPVRDEPGGDVEGYGLVFLEAAARGLAALGGRRSGAAEAIVSGETGLLVEAPERVEEVASALSTLLADPARCAALGAAGRARYESLGLPRHLASAVLADLREHP